MFGRFGCFGAGTLLLLLLPCSNCPNCPGTLFRPANRSHFAILSFCYKTYCFFIILALAGSVLSRKFAQIAPNWGPGGLEGSHKKRLKCVLAILLF